MKQIKKGKMLNIFNLYCPFTTIDDYNIFIEDIKRSNGTIIQADTNNDIIHVRMQFNQKRPTKYPLRSFFKLFDKTATGEKDIVAGNEETSNGK